MNNVVSLKSVRELKKIETEDLDYKARIMGMDKIHLLDEMVRFQEERSKVGELTLDMMVRGKILFKALEENAETQELLILTRAYRRHLEYELNAFIQQKRSNG